MRQCQPNCQSQSRPLTLSPEAGLRRLMHLISHKDLIPQSQVTTTRSGEMRKLLRLCSAHASRSWHLHPFTPRSRFFGSCCLFVSILLVFILAASTSCLVDPYGTYSSDLSTYSMVVMIRNGTWACADSGRSLYLAWSSERGIIHTFLQVSRSSGTGSVNPESILSPSLSATPPPSLTCSGMTARLMSWMHRRPSLSLSKSPDATMVKGSTELAPMREGKTVRPSSHRVDGTYLLPSEIFWRDHYLQLMEKGYVLRRRYEPTWEASWKSTDNSDSYWLYEDGQIIPVSPLAAAPLAQPSS